MLSKQLLFVGVQPGCAFVRPEQRIKSVTEADKGSNHINHKSWETVRSAVQVTQQFNPVNKDPFLRELLLSPAKTFLHIKGNFYQCNLKAC